MDINSINVPGMGVFKGGVPTERIAVRIPIKTQTEPQQIKLPDKADNVLYEKVKAAAESARSMFAVSDVRFTIFKDLAGDYVTRFTSLRDGSVKYFPQKSLFEMVSIRNQTIDTLVNSQA